MAVRGRRGVGGIGRLLFVRGVGGYAGEANEWESQTINIASSDV